jgi:hypothetical protein
MEEYLDGRYFEMVLSSYYGKKYVKYSPIHINIYTGNTKSINIDSDIYYKIRNLKNVNINILRLIIQIFDISDEKEDIEIHGRHSNTLIVDNEIKKIIRFEPNDHNIYDDEINDVILDAFSQVSKYNGYKYTEWDYHPQLSKLNHGLCVGYALKFAVDYMDDISRIRYNDDIISKFSKNIIYEFGDLPDNEDSDVEFGFGAMRHALKNGLKGYGRIIQSAGLLAFAYNLYKGYKHLYKNARPEDKEKAIYTILKRSIFLGSVISMYLPRILFSALYDDMEMSKPFYGNTYGRKQLSLEGKEDEEGTYIRLEGTPGYTHVSNIKDKTKLYLPEHLRKMEPHPHFFMINYGRKEDI